MYTTLPTRFGLNVNSNKGFFISFVKDKNIGETGHYIRVQLERSEIRCAQGKTMTCINLNSLHNGMFSIVANAVNTHAKQLLIAEKLSLCRFPKMP